MKTRYLYIVIFSLFVFTACEDKIDLELEDGKNQLVVDGFITNDNSLQVIRLTQSSPFFANIPNPPENNATVKVFGPNNIEYEFVGDSSGNFIYDPSINGALDSIGFEYKLEVTFNSNLYTATQILNPVPVIDSMTVAFEEEELGAEEGYYTQFFARDFAGRKDFTLIRPFRNGEPVYEDRTFIILSEDAAFGGDGADGFVYILPIRAAITDPDFPFELEDTSSVELLSLNSDVYQFLDQVVNSSGSDGLFATPPANFRSNIKDAAGNSQDDVLGVFSLSAISKSSILIE